MKWLWRCSGDPTGGCGLISGLAEAPTTPSANVARHFREKNRLGPFPRLSHCQRRSDLLLCWLCTWLAVHTFSAPLEKKDYSPEDFLKISLMIEDFKTYLFLLGSGTAHL